MGVVMRISGMRKQVEWGQGPFHFSGTVEIIGREARGQIEVRVVEVLKKGAWCSHQQGDSITVDKRHLGFR